MNDISKEILDKVTECKNIDEVVNVLNANGINLTKETIEKELLSNKPVELSDDDLDNVTGGVGLLNMFTQEMTKLLRDKISDLIKEKFL